MLQNWKVPTNVKSTSLARLTDSAQFDRFNSFLMVHRHSSNLLFKNYTINLFLVFCNPIRKKIIWHSINISIISVWISIQLFNEKFNPVMHATFYDSNSTELRFSHPGRLMAHKHDRNLQFKNFIT